ncbi:MAG: hypothetical protein ACN2B6_01175 [Rickettsiales bacterium]
MLNWFGKKEAVEAAKGIGTFIDEQQFTPEEQMKYKLHMFDAMGPFKGIQRVIATYVMVGWLTLLSFGALGILLGFALTLMGVEQYKAMLMFTLTKEFCMTEFVWVPCFGVFSLYLSGGLKVFKGNKK